MILFFGNAEKIYAVQAPRMLDKDDIEKLVWLFSGAVYLSAENIEGRFIGPRREMITPWSTNAVEITQNMGLEGIMRIEEFVYDRGDAAFDPMLNRRYDGLDQNIFTIDKSPDPIVYIDDIAAYNEKEGLALSDDEISYRAKANAPCASLRGQGAKHGAYRGVKGRQKPYHHRKTVSCIQGA